MLDYIVFTWWKILTITSSETQMLYDIPTEALINYFHKAVVKMDLSQRILDLEHTVAKLSSSLSNEGARNLGNTYFPGETDIGAMGSVLNDGDTAWMMTSSALVLMMTIPGLALYYGGITRTKNVISTITNVFFITCLITFLWLCFGYSLAFAPALKVPYAKSSPVYGNASRFWLRGLRVNTFHQLAPTIPETVYCVYQLTFAIITPALIVGSFADRMKFSAVIVFITLWHLICYCPIAHSTWHPEGFLYIAGVLDFAGGNVVHVSSGVAGLATSIMLGQRKGFGSEVFEPHNIMFSCVGACLLWVGWFGFNAGSAGSAGERAGNAFLVTQIGCAMGSLMWLVTEWAVTGVPKLTALVNGAVAGLVGITPACGYVDPTGAFFIGFIVGPCAYFGAQLKHYMGYDDALDAFGVHAIGGIIGGILTGFFANPGVCLPLGQPNCNGVFYSSTKNGGTQLAVQLYGITVCGGWSIFCSFIMLKIIDMTMGLRVTEEEEEAGLDASLHGETIGGKHEPMSVPTKDPVEIVVTRKQEEV